MVMLKMVKVVGSGKHTADGLDWRPGWGWGRGKKEALMQNFWLCPWSWTFQHFSVSISALKEDRRPSSWASKARRGDNCDR